MMPPSLTVVQSWRIECTEHYKVCEDIKDGIQEIKGRFPSAPNPKLAIIVMRPVDKFKQTIIGIKKEKGRQVGVEVLVEEMPEDSTPQMFRDVTGRLNTDDSVHGIMIWLPEKSESIYELTIKACNDILPDKDIDGLGLTSISRRVLGSDEGFIRPTALGILDLIKQSGQPLQGKSAVVIGRGPLVGRPAADLLLQSHATVTICHSLTQNLPEICSKADILVVAFSKPGAVTGDFVKEGAIVIDCSVHQAGRSVDPESVGHKAGYMTPVPGGVGPTTHAYQLWNTFLAWKKKVLGTPAP